MTLTILKLVKCRDVLIIIPKKIWWCMFTVRCTTSGLVEIPGDAFRTLRAIFAEGLNLFLRPRRRSDRPAAFAIHSNGKTE